MALNSDYFRGYVFINASINRGITYTEPPTKIPIQVYLVSLNEDDFRDPDSKDSDQTLKTPEVTESQFRSPSEVRFLLPKYMPMGNRFPAVGDGDGCASASRKSCSFKRS